MRVQLSLLVLSAVALLQGCTHAPVKAAEAPSTQPVIRFQKIVRFKDALGAVSDSKNGSMLTAFDYCARESRLAFVTPPLPYFDYVNYSNISTYSIRDQEQVESTMSADFVAPFTCIDQKHSAHTGILSSEDMPRGVIIHEAATASSFKPNDIVVRVGSNAVMTRAELARAVDVAPLGPLQFEVLREGRSVTVAQQVVDSTSSVQKNARVLLSALCKDTPSQACTTLE